MSGLTLFIVFMVSSDKTAIIERGYPTPSQCIAELKRETTNLGEQVISSECK